MKITEVIVEQQQLDEIDWRGLASGAANVARTVGSYVQTGVSNIKDRQTRAQLEKELKDLATRTYPEWVSAARAMQTSGTAITPEALKDYTEKRFRVQMNSLPAGLDRMNVIQYFMDAWNKYQAAGRPSQPADPTQPLVDVPYPERNTRVTATDNMGRPVKYRFIKRDMKWYGPLTAGGVAPTVTDVNWINHLNQLYGNQLARAAEQQRRAAELGAGQAFYPFPRTDLVLPLRKADGSIIEYWFDKRSETWRDVDPATRRPLSVITDGNIINDLNTKAANYLKTLGSP